MGLSRRRYLPFCSRAKVHQNNFLGWERHFQQPHWTLQRRPRSQAGLRVRRGKTHSKSHVVQRLKAHIRYEHYYDDHQRWLRNWILDGTGKASSFEEEDGTGTGRNEIRIQVGRGDHGANYMCRAENEAATEPLQTTVQVNVDRKPKQHNMFICQTPFTDNFF